MVRCGLHFTDKKTRLKAVSLELNTTGLEDWGEVWPVGRQGCENEGT